MGIPCFLRFIIIIFFSFQVKTIAKFVHDSMSVKAGWKVHVGK